MANKAKAAAKKAAGEDAVFFENAGINFRPSWKQHLAWQALEDNFTEEVSEQVRQTRHPYTTSDIRYVQEHHKDYTVAQLAHKLGRTVGSLKHFIQSRPELHKRNLHTK